MEIVSAHIITIRRRKAHAVTLGIKAREREWVSECCYQPIWLGLLRTFLMLEGFSVKMWLGIVRESKYICIYICNVYICIYVSLWMYWCVVYLHTTRESIGSFYYSVLDLVVAHFSRQLNQDTQSLLRFPRSWKLPRFLQSLLSLVYI